MFACEALFHAYLAATGLDTRSQASTLIHVGSIAICHPVRRQADCSAVSGMSSGLSKPTNVGRWEERESSSLLGQAILAST
jgi:hypothetical protein